MCRIHRPETAGQGEFCQRAMFRQDPFTELIAAKSHKFIPYRMSRHRLEMHFKQSYRCTEPLGDRCNRQWPSTFRSNHILNRVRESYGIAQVLRCVTLEYSLYAVGDILQSASCRFAGRGKAGKQHAGEIARLLKVRKDGGERRAGGLAKFNMVVHPDDGYLLWNENVRKSAGDEYVLRDLVRIGQHAAGLGQCAQPVRRFGKRKRQALAGGKPEAEGRAAMLLRDGAKHVLDVARVQAFVWRFRAGECEMLESSFGKKVHGRQDQLSVVESNPMDICRALPQMHIKSDTVLHPPQTGEVLLEIPEGVIFGEHEGVGGPVQTQPSAFVIQCGR